MGVEVIPRLTYEEFRQLPGDGKRYELIRGRVHLSPAPSIRHQLASQNLATSLGPFVVKQGFGELLTAPLDVCLNDDTALQPDLVFVSTQRLEIVQENFIAGAPDLVVEILSPSTAAHDRATKLNLYAEAGVPEVWLMDPLARTVEVLKLQGNKYVIHSTFSGKQTLLPHCSQGRRSLSTNSSASPPTLDGFGHLLLGPNHVPYFPFLCATMLTPHTKVMV